MKVLNYTTSYFAVILLILISIWAGIFYYAMLDEIYDSIDDGLDNQKGLIIQKAATDSTLLRKNNFEEGGYAITEINALFAKTFRDEYIDTMMYMQNENDYEPVRLLRTVFHHQGKYYQLHVATSMVEEDDLSSEMFYALLWLYVGLIATILIINNVLLRKIWKPFYYLLNQVKLFSLEKPSGIQLKKTKIDEFRQLNKTIEDLLQGNINTYNNQKQFIENASHELQTPLAIALNKLEVLAETAKLSDEELKLLSSALDNLERLTRLNKSLLLLSRIENKQFWPAEKININELIKKIATDFEDQLNYSRLLLNIDEQENLIVTINPDLAAILVTNLIKNAIVHNHPDGLIHITISKTFLQIENTGPEEALKKNYLFTRFNKEEQSSASAGLGLAIVKAIAELYNFNVSYSFHNRHRFTIYFK